MHQADISILFCTINALVCNSADTTGLSLPNTKATTRILKILFHISIKLQINPTYAFNIQTPSLSYSNN